MITRPMKTDWVCTVPLTIYTNNTAKSKTGKTTRALGFHGSGFAALGAISKILDCSATPIPPIKINRGINLMRLLTRWRRYTRAANSHKAMKNRIRMDANADISTYIGDFDKR